VNAKQLTEEEATEWRSKLLERSKAHAEEAAECDEQARTYRGYLDAAKARPPIADNRFSVAHWEAAIQYELALSKAHREAARGTSEEARAV